jgi:hypothetical protein
MMKRLVLLALFVGVVAFTPRPAAASYSLTASGTWHSNDGVFYGPWTATFDVAGYDLSGTLNIVGLPVPDGLLQGNIVGSWDLSHIGFGVMFLDQELATFTGGLQGADLTGAFETGDIIGQWSGSLSSLSFSDHPIEQIISSTLPTLALSQVSGTIGSVVTLLAKLYTLGAPILSTDNIINFDSLVTQILAKADGTPNCSVNSGINADAIFQFLPQGCQGSACNQVRAIISSLSGEGLPDGVALYSCKVKILASAASGIYQMVVSALQAIDINNVPLPITSLAGEIVAKVKSIFGCSCSIAETAGWLPLPSIMAPFALILLRRRARRG